VIVDGQVHSLPALAASAVERAVAGSLIQRFFAESLDDEGGGLAHGAMRRA
jgi:hypothetical protein